MVYTVSITSQGQISIPAKLRRELGLKNNTKVLAKREGQKITIEPILDLLSLKGSLQYKAIKGKTIDEIISLENKAIEEGIVERYKNSLKTIKK